MKADEFDTLVQSIREEEELVRRRRGGIRNNEPTVRCAGCGLAWPNDRIGEEMLYTHPCTADESGGED